MDKTKMLHIIGKFTLSVLKCTAALALCFLCRVLTLQDNYPLYFIATLVLALPMVLYACARTTLRKEYTLRHLNPQSRIFRFSKRRWPQYALHMLFGYAMAFILPVYLATLSVAEGLAALITLPLILFGQLLITKLVQRTYRKKYAEYKTAVWREWVMVALGAVVYSVLVCAFGGVDATRPSAFTANKIAYVIDSVLGGINTVTYAFLNNDFALELAKPVYLALSLFVLQGGILFCALSRFFMCWFLPTERRSSVFTPMAALVPLEAEEAKEPATPSEEINCKRKKGDGLHIRQRLVFYIVAVAIAATMQTGLRWLCSHEEWVNLIADKTTLIAEIVEDEVCRLGTAAKYTLLGEEFAAETKAELVAAVNTYFDQMSTKTDDYLDWYYSLGREYTELFTFLVGAVENQIEEKVGEFLDANLEKNISPGYDLESTLNSIYDENLDKFEAAKEALFQENRIENPNGLFQIQIKTTLPDVIRRTEKPEGIIGGTQKVVVTAASGTVAGVATGIVTKKLLKKLSTKLSQKVATKAVATAAKSAVKKSASKAVTSALSGAVAGLAAGPAGAVVGVVVGVATTVGLDKLLLEIDEFANRDEYKADILNCIEEERLFYLNAIATQFE